MTLNERVILYSAIEKADRETANFLKISLTPGIAKADKYKAKQAHITKKAVAKSLRDVLTQILELSHD